MIRYMSLLALLLSVAWPLAAHAADSVKFKPLEVTYLDNKNAPFKNPEGVACGAATVVVADSGNGRLVRYSLANDNLKDGFEIKLTQAPYPIRVRVDAKGELVVLDGKTRKIVRVGADNAFLSYIEPQGVPEPSTVEPRSLALDAAGNIYIDDISGERILVLDPKGVFVRQIPFPADAGFISDVAVDQRGSVYILDSLKDQVFSAVPNTQSFVIKAKGLQTYLYFPISIEVDRQGRMFLVDENDNGVAVLGQDGVFLGRYLNMGWKNGLVFYPSQGCIAGNDVFVIADRNNNRIQTFKMQ